MKKLFLILAFLLPVTFCFAADSKLEEPVEVHRTYKEQKIKVLKYEDWGYNTWIDVPYGWHVVSITANNHVVILVLEKN